MLTQVQPEGKMKRLTDIPELFQGNQTSRSFGRRTATMAEMLRSLRPNSITEVKESKRIY